MPYTGKQHRLFEAAAHDPEVAKRKDIPQATAARLAHEGVKKDNYACADNLTDGTPRKMIKVRFRNLIK